MTDLPKCVKSFFEPGGTGAEAAATDAKRAVSNSNHQRNTGGIARDNGGIEIEIFHEWFGGGPFGYTNAFAGRWELVTGIIGSAGAPKGKITFIMASDDGARLRYINEQATNRNPDACINLTSLCGQTWNIINNFDIPHGRIVNVGSAILSVAGAGGNNNTSGRYRFILEYYEKDGDATITLATGTDTFSFSDTPKQGSGTGFPEVPAIRRASSSLILNGVLDLTNAEDPYLTYYTYYELGGTGRVEVSQDGGFTWIQTGLRGRLDNSKWADASWKVEMWHDQDMDYSGTAAPNFTTTTTNINYVKGGSGMLNGRGDNLSMRFTRRISLGTLDELNFTTTADDGVRLWIYNVNDPTPMNPSGCRTGDNTFIRSGAPTTNGGYRTFDPINGCLLIDNWRGQGPTSASGSFQPSVAGTYIVQLDYFQGGGGGEVKLDIAPSNFDPPSYGGTRMPPSDWRFRVNDLSDYEDQRIGLRGIRAVARIHVGRIEIGIAFDLQRAIAGRGVGERRHVTHEHARVHARLGETQD
ncbi:hypothetical protein HC776_02415, partial [bacterium]|nr:hypothetical protein [bacterium]